MGLKPLGMGMKKTALLLARKGPHSLQPFQWMGCSEATGSSPKEGDEAYYFKTKLRIRRSFIESLTFFCILFLKKQNFNFILLTL
jgi:hypothetical protein